MSNNDLRLRVARILGWKFVVSKEDFDGWEVHRYERVVDGVLRRAVMFYTPGGNFDSGIFPLPAYGETWAACEEVLAAIKARGWWYRLETWLETRGDTVLMEIFPPKGGLLGAARCRSEVEAIPLAFVRAVEGEKNA